MMSRGKATRRLIDFADFTTISLVSQILSVIVRQAMTQIRISELRKTTLLMLIHDTLIDVNVCSVMFYSISCDQLYKLSLCNTLSKSIEYFLIFKRY